MRHELAVFLYALGLFLSMLLSLEIGRRVSIRSSKAESGAAGEGVSVVDGAIFALFGLLIAFSFSGASARFDSRRHLIVQETNDIGTAYLRIDLLPVDAQPALRESFRRYLDARIDVYRKLPDLALARDSLAKASALQRQIWHQAVAASQSKGTPSAETAFFLSAVNAMISITTTRTMASQMHPPAVVFVMLFGLAVVSSLLAGYRMTGNTVQSRLHMIAFALVTAVTVYVVMDMEYPRLGLIRVDAFDQALVDLRASMSG